MKPIYTVLLIGLLTGCGKKEASKPQAEAKASSTQDAKKGKPKTPSKPNPTKPAPKSETTQQVSKPKTNPWDTPIALALFMADKTKEPMKISILMAHAQAQVKAGDKEQALATLKQAVAEVQKMPDKEEQPMMLTFIAKTQVDAGNKEQALATLKQANGDPSSGGRAHFRLVEVLVYAGDKEQALAVFEQLAASAPKTGPGKEMVLARKASILAQVGEIGKAVEAVQTIEDPSAKAILLMEIAKAQAKEGDKPKASATFRQAKETLAKIKEKFPGQKSDYLGVIAEAQIKAGFLEPALATCKQIKVEFLKLRTDGGNTFPIFLVDIAMIQLEAKGLPQALATLKQAGEFVQKEGGGRGNDCSLDRLAIGLALAGKPKQALETAQKIGETSEKADVLMHIGGILGAAGNHEQALPALKLGLQMALKEIQNDEDARSRERKLIRIMAKLAMEPITAKMVSGPQFGGPIRPDQPMKKAFTAEEKELAKQFVEAIQAK